MNKPEPTGQYEVLSPWSEIDPITPQVPATRLDTLEKKKIGLFCNYKRSARPMLELVGEWLTSRFQGLEVSLYALQSPNVPEMESSASEAFAAWIDEMDAVVLAVGD